VSQVVPLDALATLRPQRPAVLFLGVSTAGSTVHKAFPSWLDGRVDLVGVDTPVGTPPERFRAFAEYLAGTPTVLGAVVTTHKLALFDACRGLSVAWQDPAAALAEVNALARTSEGGLAGYATDTAASARAVGEIGIASPAQVLCFGAGGAAIAIVCALADLAPGSRITVGDVDQCRLAHLDAVTGDLPVLVETRAVAAPQDNDAMLESAPAEVLVINATGLGKVEPGSPLTAAPRFPDGAVAWDLNYRGPLTFLAQASGQGDRGVRAVDGWQYFLHGWSTALQAILGPEAADLPARIAATPRQG
jgi:shikimate 5-dehydrogenase